MTPTLDEGRFPVKRIVGDVVRVGADIFKDGHDPITARLVVRPPGPPRKTPAQVIPLVYEYNPDRWFAEFVVDRIGRWTFTIEAETAKGDVTTSDVEYAIVVDREQARFSTWYEFFPRSTDPRGKHGTFRTAIGELDRIAKLGFDVVYLPPIHPVGRGFRKGKNNTLNAEPDDVGSPWAIGNEFGGHDAVNPELGTIDDFDAFVAAARERHIEVALDYALQCSPDHPWLKQHPEWFNKRPDGTIAYAENPPKKYQDIYPLNFWCDDREALWNACRDIVLHWVAHGVKIFRVDNPHTKPFAFWEWLITEVQSAHPDVIFFSEAFTRPKRMQHLAKLGFTMSYTYFTWKNSAWELRGYLSELHSEPRTEYFRGNLFVNTPDILHEYLVKGGRPAFRARLVLAATLSPLYGMYSGYELIENTPLKEGSEEYLDSEKYQLRPRDWNAEGNINADVALVNRIRREHLALQRFGNLTFLPSDNEQILFYRRDPDVYVAVNLDPHNVQSAVVHLPQNGVPQYRLRDVVTGASFTWNVGPNYVRLDPREHVAHILVADR